MYVCSRVRFFMLLHLNPFFPTVPTFAVRETDVSRHDGGTSGAPLKPLGQQMLELGCENATVGKNGLSYSKQHI